MTERGLAALALKIWGILWIVSAVARFPQIVIVFVTKPFLHDARGLQAYSEWTSVFAIVVTFIIGIVMIKASDRIATLLLAGDGEVTLPFRTVELEQVAFGILGAYLLALALRELADIAFVLMNKPMFDPTDSLRYLFTNGPNNIAAAIAQAVAGTALFLGRRGLARFWQKLRPMASDEQ